MSRFANSENFEFLLSFHKMWYYKHNFGVNKNKKRCVLRRKREMCYLYEKNLAIFFYANFFVPVQIITTSYLPLSYKWNKKSMNSFDPTF